MGGRVDSPGHLRLVNAHGSREQVGDRGYQHHRYQQPVRAAHLRNHDQGGDRDLGDPGEEPPHSHQHTRGSRRRELRRHPLHQVREDGARDPPDHQRRREDTPRSTGGNGERGGEDLGRQEQQEHLQGQLAVEGQLQPTITTAEHLRHRHCEEREEQAADRRSGPGRNRHSRENVIAHAVKDLDVDHADQRHDHSQHEVGEELLWLGEGQHVGFEDHVPPGEGGNHHVGHDGGDDGRDERLGLEVRVRVEHLDRKQSAPERGTEHAADTRSHPRDDENPTVVERQPQEPRQV